MRLLIVCSKLRGRWVTQTLMYYILHITYYVLRLTYYALGVTPYSLSLNLVPGDPPGVIITHPYIEERPLE